MPQRVLGRKKMGLTFIKFDVGMHVLDDRRCRGGH